MDPKAVYLDYNATTPLAPQVREVLVAALERFGNPSSIHRFGAEARFTIEKSRKQIAKLLHAFRPEEIVFTSGGSESDNLAIRGAAFAARRAGIGNHLITSNVEHKAVLDTCLELRDLHGFDLTILSADQWGRVGPGNLQASLRPDTVLVSIMMANNELGSINSINDLARVTRENSKALFHTDGVQAAGKHAIDLQALGVDLFTLTAHKIHGPIGVGALWIRDEVVLEPQLTGGGQEFKQRAGTENTAGIAALAAALKLVCSERESESMRLQSLREVLWQSVSSRIPIAIRNSPPTDCLANTLSFSVLGLEGPRLVGELDRLGYAISAGSACSAGSTKPSHVMEAVTSDRPRQVGALRVSMGRDTTRGEVDGFVGTLCQVVQELGG